MSKQHWYLRSVEEVYDDLETNQHGLTDNEAAKRLEKYGPNAIAQAEGFKPLKSLLRQINSLLIYILLGTAIISLLGNHAIEFWVILAILGFTILFSWFQEYQAAQSVQALQELSAKKVLVRRAHKDVEVSSKQLVPGDVVVLERGMILPADMRVVESNGLRLDESVLTGESVQKPKQSAQLHEQDVSIADQNNLVFSGTSITTGSGLGVVVATGQLSAIGKISQAIKEIGHTQTPLQRRVDDMSKRISYIVLGVAALFFLVLLAQQQPIFAALLLVGALAVSGIPESFPLVLTVALTNGVRSMAAHNALVKDMASVETLGTATVICTDKTGTLTQNRMRVTNVVFPGEKEILLDGTGYQPVGDFQQDGSSVSKDSLKRHEEFFKACVFCNDATLYFEGREWALEGEPTEGALLTLAKTAGYDDEVLREHHPRQDQIPFDPKEKFMVTAHANSSYLKGAVERVIQKCSYVRENSKKKKLSKKHSEQLLSQASELSNSQLRVLAIASKSSTSNFDTGFVFEGLVGIKDPVRQEALQAVTECRKAGVEIIMITGDHASTARSIAEELSIVNDKRHRVIVGSELDKISDSKLDAMISEVAVFARTTPDHKLRIVSSLQRQKEIVAMTGDGVNDAPALKKADLGVSMGRTGTEVARQASNLVLADDNFATIVEAIRRGRTIYSNIRRFIFYLLTGNFTEVSLIFFAVLIGLQSPLTAILVLFINLVTSSLPAFALAVEPTKEEVMSHKPRDPSERILGSYLLTKILVLIPLLLAGSLAMFLYALNVRQETLMYAQTLVFATIVCFELFHVFNARSLHASIFSGRFFKNKYIFFSVGLSAGLMLAVIYVPALQVVMGTAPLVLSDWALVVAVSSSVIVFSEVVKLMIHSEIRERASLYNSETSS